MFNLYLHCIADHFILFAASTEDFISFGVSVTNFISFDTCITYFTSVTTCTADLISFYCWCHFSCKFQSLLRLSNIDFDFSVAVYITDFISYLVLVDTPSTNFTLIATPAFQCNFHFGCCCIMDNSHSLWISLELLLPSCISFQLSRMSIQLVLPSQFSFHLLIPLRLLIPF